MTPMISMTYFIILESWNFPIAKYLAGHESNFSFLITTQEPFFTIQNDVTSSFREIYYLVPYSGHSRWEHFPVSKRQSFRCPLKQEVKILFTKP
jgi:hypothetical protein